MHIILIGFKHVGKSTIGKLLSEKLSLPAIDLDREIEKRQKQNTGITQSCRQIFFAIGEQKFRELEHNTLAEILSNIQDSIVSLGGGTPLAPKNRKLVVGQIIIHITSKKEIVYERIMLSGKPAFLSPDENTYESFERVWEERKPMYESLATITVENNGSREKAVETIYQQLNLYPIPYTL